MAFHEFFELEEKVGRFWHRLVGERYSWPRYPEAAVSLDHVRGQLSVFFRGLGGDKGVAITAADLTGRYLLKGGDTVWADGPLTHAVRNGGIAYLDEVVEARKDVTVVLHPLTDDRRLLPLDRTGELLAAPDDFMLVVSYNPGYQNVLKQLKPSTRQRFVAIEFDFPPPEVERQVVVAETGLPEAMAHSLVMLAGRLRALKGHDLEEGVSTRLLVYCATLVQAGMSLREAVQAAMIEPLTDDADVKKGLDEVVLAVFG